MLDTLTWWQRLSHSEIASGVEDRRQESLRFFVAVSAIGYLSWHFVSAVVDTSRSASVEQIARHWALLPIVAAGLGGTYLLQEHRPRFGVGFFLVSSLVSITAAIWLLAAPLATVFYSLVVLAAVVLLHPLAGLMVTATSLGLLVGLRDGPLEVVGFGRVVEVGITSLLTVVAAWALGRNMVIAVGWSIDSFGQAVRNAEEARTNRVELVQALQQLDHAYYRLQRANAALELAWKAAEAAERSKTEFVTNISHELRTPLNLVIGFSEMILTSPESYRAPLPPAYRGDLNAIYRSAQHLLTLTNDVIDLARVGVGRLALVREPVDLGQVIADACAIVQEYVSAKGLWLRMEVQADLPVLELDRLRIRQVLLNLLTNAARFTERGGLTVGATLEGARVLVKVADTGRGIGSKDIPRVFEQFYHDGEEGGRADDGLGGIGLGLPISKRFVELHGGRMGVDSTVGVGTTFWFTLPTTTAEREGGPSGLGPAWRSVDWTAPPGARERILVLAGAEDQLGQFLQRHLNGYRIVTRRDARSAADAAIELRALAILTSSENESDGWTDAPVPVFRLPSPSGMGHQSTRAATAHLVKPVSRAQLEAALARVDRPVRTVLIADDDPRFGRLIERFLQAGRREPGYEIVNAHNGREALELMSKARPDLVLLDLVMPELGGAAVLAAMRATPTLADVPVIVMSAQDEIGGNLPLHGPLWVDRVDGFRLEEVLGALEALLEVLEPPRGYLTEGREGGDELELVDGLVEVGGGAEGDGDVGLVEDGAEDDRDVAG